MRCQGALGEEKKGDGDESGMNYSEGGKEELEEVGAAEGKDKELPRCVPRCLHPFGSNSL